MYVSGLYRSSMRDDFSRCAERERVLAQRSWSKTLWDDRVGGDRVAVAKAAALC